MGTGMWTNKGFYESGEVIQTRAHILEGQIINCNTTPTPGGTEMQVSFTPKSSTSTIIFEYSHWVGVHTGTTRQNNFHIGFWLYDHTNSTIVECNNASSANTAENDNGDTPQWNMQMNSQFGIAAPPRS